ncbi:rabphilin-3A [Anoplophora glabripennis]|uniref:rabphilin-3A n=1 Tax=Anoplophora glabripennis TaxID=217634 RepID=UPI000C771EBD|nr:rabphilin-3A [Anoplophora glabripennis]
MTLGLARLNTGWSVKTSALGCSSSSSKSQPLAAEEQEAIVQVIQRAEKIDVSEQERIGKLVERLENMRRCALGRNPSQCLLCGDAFGMLGAQKVLCLDCRRLACQKCAIEFYGNKSHCNSKENWLCMICAETREIWKKSGAWFFKSIPKYILPVETRFVRNRSVRMSRKHRDEDSSSDEEKRVWNKVQRRNSSTESTHDIQDQEPHQNFPMSNYSRQTSSNESQMSKDVEPLKNYMSTVTLSEIRSWDDSGTEAKGETESSDASRRESMASRSMSDWNWSDTRSDDKISPSTCSINSSIFKSSSEEHKPVDNPMGIIELSLNYDQLTNTLHCTVYRAKNLIPMDISGLSDPFCKLNILPTAKVSTRLRTKTVHKTRNPEFNENLTFYDITESDLMKKSLHILMVDDDKYGHDYMGETRIALAKLKVQNTMYLTVPLENLRSEQKGPLPAPEMNEWFDDLWSRGQILLSLCYSTKRRALLVTVARCVNLLPMDNNGFSDPFVKLQLKPDPYHRKHKTSIKWKNLNPVYNEEFAFETRPTELYTQSLYITVFDKDYGKSNDYLGGLILGGTGSKGQRLKHWLDMIRYPDHRHEQWHNLTEDVLE